MSALFAFLRAAYHQAIMDFLFSNGIVGPAETRVSLVCETEPVRLAGPFSAKGRTLPSYTFFRRSDAGSFEGDVIDPAVWTPDHPIYYELQFDSHQFDRPKKRIVGIRKPEATKSNVYLNGRRYVFRGAEVKTAGLQKFASLADLQKFASLNEHHLSILVCLPTDELLNNATLAGVPVILDGRSTADEMTEFLSWPCVQAIILRSDSTDSITKYESVLRLADLDKPAALPNWAHGAFVRQDKISQFVDADYPIFVAQNGNPDLERAGISNTSEIRTSCERLQCELAPQFNLAGYFV